MTLDEFRALALALPGVEEGMAFGTPIWRVGKLMLARVWAEGEVVLKMEEGQREVLIAARPDLFFVTDHHRGHPLGLARLAAAEPSDVEPFLESAWERIAPRRLVRGR